MDGNPNAEQEAGQPTEDAPTPAPTQDIDVAGDATIQAPEEPTTDGTPTADEGDDNPNGSNDATPEASPAPE